MQKYIKSNILTLTLSSIFLLLCSMAGGLIWFALQSNLIIIRWPTTHSLPGSPSTTQPVTIWYYKNNQWMAHTQTLTWPSHAQQQLEVTAQSWLHHMCDESIIKMTTLQMVLLSVDQKTVYLSFTKSLFNKQQSIESKLKIIESLSKTLKEAAPSIQGIQLLVNHKPLDDPHLDFLQPWSLYC